MVSEGGPQVLPVGVRKTIQQIREIVGNHSDADIYSTLKETNMDPNETTQKLLHQDPYHEVKRKRDKKKEHQAHQAQHQGHQAQQYQGHQGPQHQVNQAQQTHQTYQKHQSHQTRQSHQNPVYKGSTASEPKQNAESEGHSVNPAMYSNRNVRRAGYGRNGMSGAGVSREFRIVRDNRGKQNSFQDSKSVESSSSPNDVAIPNESVKSPSVTQKPSFGRNSSNGDNDSQTKQPKDGNISATVKKDLLGGQRLTVSSTDPQIQPEKADDTQLPSTASSSNSVVGVYSSSSDPVHVPSPDSRPTAKIGAIKREVGVVGAHRQNTENSSRLSSSQANSFTNLHLGRESPRSFGTSSKVDQVHNVVSETGLSVSRSFTNNQYGRGHQLAGHQKAPQPNKEWKPKSSQRTSMNGPGVIGSPTNAAIPSLDISKDAGRESANLEDKMSQVNLAENQNVILASNIRAPDQFRLVFGSLDPDLTLKSGFQAVGSPEELPETSARLQILSPPEPSHNEAVNSKPQDLVEDHARNSGTDSPASASVSDNQLNDKKEEVSSSTNLDNYGDIRLAQDHNVAYGSQEAHQHQEVSELQTFQPPYDHNQHAYEMSYFPTIDEHVRAQGLPSPQEVINSHSMSSSMAMVQQQQQQAMAQMYPQVHYNMMPYRQYPTAVYVPQMVPSYSSNPTYPHPSNGGNYVLMPPGNNSHVTANGLKYGIQQFKPVTPGNPTPFGSYTTPAGYTPGVVGSAPGLEDPSRLKYKENFYLPNPQAETSEIWMNPRDMQPGSYYNMPGQAPPHAAAYMPSHGAHASYNPAAAAHSSHMQYPGIYHPTPQPAPMPSPHHMGPAMGGNIGVAAAGTGPQVGAYQQPPQLGHLSWPGSF